MLAVLAAITVLGIIAWQMASAPALLLGSDPQFESAVDERVRVGRARGIASLACVLGSLLAIMAVPKAPSAYHLYGEFAPLFLNIAALVAVIATSAHSEGACQL